MRRKLLLLGAGPTSSLIAYNIQNSKKLNDMFKIHVWEKSQNVGGRFSTTRNPGNSNSYADLGAQYLTWNGQPFSKPFFDNLVDNKLIKKIDTSNIPGFRPDPQKINYVSSYGMASIVQHFFENVGESSVLFNRKVTGISVNSNMMEVETEAGIREKFDMVISTIPAPQLLQIYNIDNILKDNKTLKNKLEDVSYTTRYAMGLFYDEKDGPFAKPLAPFNFVSNDPTIRYWSIENMKRSAGEETSEPCAVVVHTSTTFGAEYFGESSDSMQTLLLEKVYGCIPDIQKNKKPSFVQCQEWMYSQVEKAFEGAPGFMKLAENFIVAGDGFSQSGFEGCILSAQKTIEYLENAYIPEIIR